MKLHTAYEQKLYRIALKILRSHELAEDAVQQSWVQVIQHFEKVKQVPWGAVDGYLVVIVKNVSMTMLRKENHTDPLPEDWDAPAPSAPEMDETGRIVELIRSMPDTYREVLELRCVLEWSNKDIARRLSLSENAVAVRLMRGKALLQNKLEQEGYGREGFGI